MTRKMIVRRSKGGRQALYVSVDPIRPGRDWGSGVEVPSPIMGDRSAVEESTLGLGG